MKHAFEYAGSIPMTAGGSVAWSRYEVPALDGQLLLAPSAPRGTAHALLHYAEAGIPGWGDRNHDLEGSYGRIKRVGDMAVKVFAPDVLKYQLSYVNDGAAGVTALRANVTMHAGFLRVQHGLRPTVELPRLAAPEQFGAFLANDWKDHKTHTSAVWAMEFVTGTKPTELNSIMPQADRHVLYRRALATCGVGDRGDISALDLNDDLSQNAFVANDGSNLVRFDFIAQRRMSDYF